MNKKLVVNSVKHKSVMWLTRLSTKKRRMVIVGAGVLVLAVVGTVGALNGWFGGGAKIPEDTMTRGLVGYWSMDEGSGDFVYDQSDYQNMGHVAPAGKSLYFDGTDDYVNIPNSATAANLNTAGDITVMAWINPTRNAWQYFIGKSAEGTSPVSFQFGMHSNGYWFWRYGSVPNINGQIYLGTPVINQWAHLAFTYDKSLPSANIKFYLNGVQGGSTIDIQSDIISNAYNLFIGADDKSDGSPSRPWQGFIDEVRIYNRALSATEMTECYKGVFCSETGLVRYWSLDDGQGTTAYDKSQYKNNGTLANGPVWKNNAPRWSEGAPATNGGTQGTALEFDGVDDYVDAGSDTIYNFTSESFSLSFWAKAAGVPSYVYRYVTRGTPNNNGWTTYSDSGGNFVFNTQHGGTVSSVIALGAIEIGVWKHIIVTRDGSTAKIYVNGILEGATSTIADAVTSSDHLTIGIDSNFVSYPFNGLIDEVRIYNRALSSEEVRYHYNRGSPVAHWTFDEGNGTTTYDSTDNGNDGQFMTANTSPTWTTGKYGTALQFDGENDYVSVPNSSSTEITSAVTISAWIKAYAFPATNQYAGILMKGDAPAYDINYQMRFNNAGGRTRPELQFLYSAGEFDEDVTEFQTGTWYHLVIMFDEATDNIKFYVNGINTKSIKSTGTLVAKAYNIYIGSGYNSGIARFFNGIIDDVSIYNYARSADEIRLDYNAGFGVRFGGSPADDMTRGLAGYWNMDEGNGDFVYDQSDYQNMGHVAPAGKSLQFDGTDDKVVLSTFPNFADTIPWSASAWTKVDLSAGNDHAIFGTNSGTDYEIRLRQSGADALTLFYVNNVYQGNVTISNVSLSEWHYWVFTMTSGRLVTVYLDGVLRGAKTNASSAMKFEVIGATPANALYSKGIIDEVRIYNRVLSETEAREHYKGIFDNETGLVGYWPLDDGKGTIAYDKSQYKNNGTLTSFNFNSTSGWKNNAPRWAEGAPSPSVSSGSSGSALRFDGVDDYVEVSSLASSTHPSNGTIMFWAKPERWSAYDNIFSTAEDDANMIQAQWAGDGDIAFNFCNSAGGWSGNCAGGITTGSGKFPLNTWTHIVLSWDVSVVRVYVNGVLMMTATVTTFPSTYPEFHIGEGWGSRTFKGSIDEFRFYNRALSAEEIRYHYNRGGPVAHWKFDEGNGTTTYDSTWDNNDGQFATSGTSPVWVSGKYGTALLFDGENDYVDIADDTTLRFGTDDFTLEAWINTVSSFGGQMIMSNYNAADQVFGMWVHSEGKFKAVYRDAPILETNVASNNAVNDGNWHHVVAQRFGNFIYVYVDGIRQTETGIGVDDANFDPNGGWEIGHQPGSADRYFNGLIDDVRIYNYARTAEEIGLDYNEGLAGRFAPTDAGCDKDPAGCMSKGLVGYWGMDEGGGDFVYDQSDYQNTGYVRPTGKALYFDGTDDYVDAEDAPVLNFGTGDFSFEFWMYSNSITGNQGLIGKRAASLIGFDIIIAASTGRLKFSIQDSGGASSMETSVNYMNEQVWRHVFVVIDRDDISKIYVDGEVRATSDLSARNGDISTPGERLRIATARGANQFGGFLDEVRIYNRAISATEATEHYKGIFSNETNLMAYWPFDEGYGTKANDESGKGNHGTLENGSVWKNNAPRWTQGVKPLSGGYLGGGAMEFDGVDDYVNVGSGIIGTNVLHQGTYEAWVKTQIGTFQYVIVGGSYTLRFAISSTGLLGFYFTSAGASGVLSTTVIVPNNIWTHIAVSFQDNTIATTNNVKFYVNGIEQIMSKNYAASAGTFATYLGLYPPNLSPFNGLIDEVRIYNRALSAEEVRYHYNRGGPVAEWKFDEGSGTTTYDETNNNNDGTFVTADTSPVWVAGKYGSALQFDGVNDYVIKSSFTGQPTGNGARTIAVWVKPNTGFSGNNVIAFFGIDSPSPYGYGVYLNSSYKVKSEFDSGNGLVTGNTTLSSDAWHHVVVTYDGSTNSIYVDGVLDTSVSYSSANTQVGNVYIGTWGSLASYFNGLIDEVRIYNYARTQEQILIDYNAGLSTYFK